MDSLSQIVLGAAVGEAVLGKKIGGKAALWGAILGTIPDLDVLLKNFFSNPVSQDLAHRGFSHSILFAIAMAFGFGYLLFLLFKKRVEIKKWRWFVFLCVVTHPMLDIFTTWGTQFLWPAKAKLTFNSIFVVDPLYTLPFLIFLIIALLKNRESKSRRKWNNAGLIWSTSYLLIGVIIKLSILFTIGNKFPDKEFVRHSVKPMPLTTFYWGGISEDKEEFILSYHHLWKKFDSKDLEIFPKNHSLLDFIDKGDQDMVDDIKFITKGYLSVEQVGDTLLCKDLRFGTISKLTNGKVKTPLMGYGLILEGDRIKQIYNLRDNNNMSAIDFGAYMNEIF